MKGFTVHQGGRSGASPARAYAAGAQAYAQTLGQTYHTAPGNVTESDVINELTHRGYKVQVVHDPIHHAPVVVPTLTKSMAISVAIDEGLRLMSLPRTSTHPYRCPTSGCGISQNNWTSLIQWCVKVANGYLTQLYGLPSWASSALHSGSLRGTVGLSGLGNLGAFQDWLQENDWLVTAVGGAIQNYGQHLTAKNVQDAIKESTAGQFTKDDALALVAALQQKGMITPGTGATVAAGANAAASPAWMIPVMIGAGVLVVVMMMKK